MSDLKLEAVNDHDEVIYRLAWNQPVPWCATLYRNDRVCTRQEVLDALRARALVYAWLMKEMDRCGMRLALRWESMGDGPGYLPYVSKEKA